MSEIICNFAGKIENHRGKTERNISQRYHYPYYVAKWYRLYLYHGYSTAEEPIRAQGCGEELDASQKYNRVSWSMGNAE